MWSVFYGFFICEDDGLCFIWIYDDAPVAGPVRDVVKMCLKSTGIGGLDA